MSTVKYLKVLGLQYGASKADIKHAFRRLALRWHPDKNPDNLPAAEKQFKLILDAYEQLTGSDESSLDNIFAGFGDGQTDLSREQMEEIFTNIINDPAYNFTVSFENSESNSGGNCGDGVDQEGNRNVSADTDENWGEEVDEELLNFLSKFDSYNGGYRVEYVTETGESESSTSGENIEQNDVVSNEKKNRRSRKSTRNDSLTNANCKLNKSLRNNSTKLTKGVKDNPPASLSKSVQNDSPTNANCKINKSLKNNSVKLTNGVKDRYLASLSKSPQNDSPTNANCKLNKSLKNNSIKLTNGVKDSPPASLSKSPQNDSPTNANCTLNNSLKNNSIKLTNGVKDRPPASLSKSAQNDSPTNANCKLNKSLKNNSIKLANGVKDRPPASSKSLQNDSPTNANLKLNKSVSSNRPSSSAYTKELHDLITYYNKLFDIRSQQRNAHSVLPSSSSPPPAIITNGFGTFPDISVYTTPTSFSEVNNYLTGIELMDTVPRNIRRTNSVRHNGRFAPSKANTTGARSNNMLNYVQTLNIRAS